MRNAKKYSTRITIGGVPSREDLEQLQALGYRTLVDLRDDNEKFGGRVCQWTLDLHMRYVGIPIQRTDITMDDALTFYNTVYDPDAAPLYLFSRFGKRPLALLLLLEAVVRKQPLVRIYQAAAEFGLNLEGDLCLSSFLVGFYNSRELGPILEGFARERPELFKLPG